MTICVAKKFVRYLRHTRAVAALEYAIVVGFSVVVFAAVFESFRSDITAAITALMRQLNGG